MFERVRQAFPPVDAALRSRPAQVLRKAPRRRAVLESPLAFGLSELVAPAGRRGVYRLRGSDAHIAVRHRTRDIEIFDEIFGVADSYGLPERVRAVMPARRPRILDLGANIGLFGAYALRAFPDAQLTSLEPDPLNLPVLRRCMEVNDVGDAWTLIEACAGNAAGMAYLEAGNFADSRVSDASSPNTVKVPVIDVLPTIAASDLVKIDIEGSEWPILLDPRFAHLPTPAMTIEWHRYGAPSGDPRAAAIDAFSNAGFEIEASPPSHHGHGTIWAWRPGP